MNAEIDLKRLRHLVLLDEELNFTRAAERANLSQTAFSRSIQALEAGFGVRIFDRGTRSVRVTSAGRHLATKARKLLAHARDLAREVDDIAHAEGGELFFGASLMAIDGALRGVLPMLRQQSPRLKINVEVSQWQLLQQHLEHESIEFYVGYPGHLAHNRDFAVTPLRPEPASIFCQSNHPLVTSDAPTRPQRVPDYPWGSVQLPDAVAEQMRELFGVPEDAALPLVLSCDNQALLREAMLTSDMLLFSWRSWLQTDLQAGTAVDLGSRLSQPLPRGAMQVECAIVQLAGHSVSPAAQRLMGLIARSEGS